MNPGRTTRPRRSVLRVPLSDQRSTWVSVPAATIRPSRIANAVAHDRPGAAVNTRPPTKTRSAPRCISPHVPKTSEAIDRFLQRLVPFREHEPDESLSVVRVPVKGAAGDDRDPKPLDEVHRERPVVGEGERGDVRHDVIRAPRSAAVEPGVEQTADEGIAFRLVAFREAAVVRLREFEGGHG